ncbi:molybdenum ABC transporter ATP-binding protein [Aquabacterium sp.]|uniref:molybdenum ABC transporter ATP-binding protein n=1 Tax=Aquabacterium sp. TaxID=1872578 RepID=UPI0035B13451
MSEVQADLQLDYPGFALNVSLRLPGKGVSVLLGPSGCGKTTILRALAGLERPRGRVSLNGSVWQDDAAQAAFVPTHRRAIGYVFQEASLFPHLSVRSNLEYGRRRIPESERRVGMDEAVELLGIGHLLDRRPDRLSGGERQRVAIARALLTSPRLLLMDEPLSALDPARKAEILPYLERLNRSLGLPMVYVTHSHEEAARLADHLVLMQSGQVVASGPAAELMARLDLPLSHADDAAALIQARVVEHDPVYGQTRLDLAGQSLWVGASDALEGDTVRARVLARDVSVVLARPVGSSIVNILPAQIEALRDDGPDTVTLQLRIDKTVSARGESPLLLARITRRSCDALRLRPGGALFAQIKGVALMG